MTRLHEEIETPLPLDVAFPFVADFANSSRWDPGVKSSEAVDPGPLAVGARYRLMVRMGGRFAPMEYRISSTAETPEPVPVSTTRRIGSSADTRYSIGANRLPIRTTSA